jgi:hypothetical protein
MKAESASETSVTLNHITRLNIPEDNSLHNTLHFVKYTPYEKCARDRNQKPEKGYF